MQIGDWVIVGSNPYFLQQWREKANCADGTIVDVVKTMKGWWWVKFPNGYQNNYPELDLRLVNIAHHSMPEPETSLDEIHLAQEIMEGLT